MNTPNIKIEPPDAVEPSTSPLNLSSATNGEKQNGDLSSAGDIRSQHDVSDSRNFTCLLCDVVCLSRDLLRKHLKDFHASKQYDTTNLYGSFVEPGVQTSGYLNYRYTCTICRAKFKSFRTYVTHTMSHRGMGTSHFDDVRMVALLGAGKQYMQDYFDSEDGYGGGFTCSECKTVFMQRDSYAMHMMMRAMNETCKSTDNTLSTNNNEADDSKDTDQTRMPAADDISPPQDNGESQRCLEDVTSKVDQDEYLKSVLDKVCSADPNMKNNRTHYAQGTCTFCGNSYQDQDALAMHVMSDHADEMTSNTPSRSSVTGGMNIDAQNTNTQSYLSWMAGAAAAQSVSGLTYLCKYCNTTFMSRDSLAMHVLTHAHIEEKLADYSRYSRKRKVDSQDQEDLPKLQRREGNINGLTEQKNSGVNEKTLSPVNLYCDKCGIKFYATSEYEWHMKRHADSTLSPENIKKTSGNQGFELASPTGKTGIAVSHCTSNMRLRRNSTSSCSLGNEKNEQKALPRRPVSVDICSSNSDPKAQVTSGLQPNANIATSKEHKSSVPDLESVISNVRSLSSNEQRIIYSVFGKDLNLNVSKSVEKFRDAQQKHHTVDPQRHTQGNVEQRIPVDASSNKTHPSLSPVVKNTGPNDRQKLIAGDKDAPMCKYCEIVFFNKAIYYLHMGLHNVNNPWQCNVCGKICNDAVDFAAHVIHM